MGNCQSGEAVAVDAEHLESASVSSTRSAAKLTLLVMGVRGLRRPDWVPDTGRPKDCFCLVKAVSKGEEMMDKTRQLHKTEAIRSSMEPVWSEEADFNDFGEREWLEFSVWEADASGSKELLGKASLGRHEFETVGFNDELKLDRTKKGVEAYLRVKVMTCGRGYPTGILPEITVSFDKDKRKKQHGLEVDGTDGVHLYVTEVTAGPVQTFNEGVKPKYRVKSGDFIVSANGVRGSARDMLNVLKTASSLDLVVRRPEELRVAIDKKDPRRPLGLGLQMAGQSVLISKVEAGPFQEWNDGHADSPVRCGDRIVAVGAARGRAKDLAARMTSAAAFQALVVRPACPDSWLFQ